MHERIRKFMAIAGCGLWVASSFMPMLGMGAKHEALCRGREFTGTFDDCFNDYLPVLELFAPVFAVPLHWFFAKFAVAVWAPEPAERTMRWRLAPKDGTAIYHPGHMVLGLIGAAWPIWRAASYPLDPITLPYIGFWLLFALWFTAGAVVIWRSVNGGASPEC